jgi:hypothetical protein
MDVLKAEAVVPAGDPSLQLSGCFAADLMSDVLAFARPGSLLLTGLATEQTIRTASIRHLAAVILVAGKQPDGEMIEGACEAQMPLYQTPLSKYEACGLLMQAGLRPYRASLT